MTDVGLSSVYNPSVLNVEVSMIRPDNHLQDVLVESGGGKGPEAAT